MLDEYGRSDFDRLRARAKTRMHKPGADTVVYCVFDLLVAEGKSTRQLPLARRKALLSKVFESKPDFTVFVQHVESEGVWLYDHAKALGLERIVSKRTDSLYMPGERSRDWVKRKRPGATPAQRFNRGPNKPLD